MFKPLPFLFYSIKTPKDSNYDKYANLSKNLFEIGAKIDHKKLFLSNNPLMNNQGNKSVKGSRQSRNVTNNLINNKSQGANLDSFSFIRPQSMKNGSQYERRQRKQK